MGTCQSQGSPPLGLLLAARPSLAGRWTMKTTRDYEDNGDRAEATEDTRRLEGRATTPQDSKPLYLPPSSARRLRPRGSSSRNNRILHRKQASGYGPEQLSLLPSTATARTAVGVATEGNVGTSSPQAPSSQSRNAKVAKRENETNAKREAAKRQSVRTPKSRNTKVSERQSSETP